MKTSFTISGMHCTSCKMLIEDTCSEVKGVTSCTVDVKTGKGSVDHDASFSFDLFRKEIEKLGNYKVKK